jgi:hypothetical protein
MGVGMKKDPCVTCGYPKSWHWKDDNYDQDDDCPAPMFFNRACGDFESLIETISQRNDGKGE